MGNKTSLYDHLISLKEEAVTYLNAYERCATPFGKGVSKGLFNEVTEQIQDIEFDMRMERNIGI